MIYFITIALLIILIVVYDFYGLKKNKFGYYYLVLIVLILTAGLRFRIGLDTIRYMSFYKEVPTIFDVSLADFNETRYDPIFYMLSVFSKSISSNFVCFQILHAIIINSVVFYFIKNNTKYIFSGVLLYYIFCFTNFNFEVMREAIAVAIFLLSADSLLRRNWKRYYLFAIIAFLTHSSAIVLIFVPLFMGLKATKHIYLYLFGVFLISLMARDYVAPFFELIAITDSISEKTTRYLDDELMGQVLNLFGITAKLFTYIIFPLIAIYFLKLRLKLRFRYEFLIILNCFVAIMVIEYAIFYRYFNYFILFEIVLLAEFGGRLAHNVYSKFALAIVTVAFSGIIFLQIYSYFRPISQQSNIRAYSRYYPYSSIFTNELNDDREVLFKYYDAYF